jgi:hypothetical protein
LHFNLLKSLRHFKLLSDFSDGILGCHRPATTFRACSSPAPTRVKPQPAPAILSQESVHTTLSITHHTRKRPSTGPRTTHGPQTAPVRTTPRRALLQQLRRCEACGNGAPPRLPLHPVRIDVSNPLKPGWGRHGQPLRLYP